MTRRQPKSERLVVSALQSQLRPDEFLLENIRFSDSQYGDIECDVLVFCPDLGIAAIEIKGGVVSYANGEWTVSTGNAVRRTNPVEQARNAKHAVRRYLSRQNEWTLGLIRSEWLVALPFTSVKGDLGTEGRRDLLIDADELAVAMDKVRAALDSNFHTEERPSSADLEAARNLILRANPTASAQRARHPRDERVVGFATLGVLLSISFVLSDAVLSSITSSNHLLSAAIMAPVGAGVAALVARRPHQRKRRIAWGAGAASVGALLGGFLLADADVSAASCSKDYSPCIPIVKDLDCTDITGQVTVIGEDIYGLDRDGDGKGCEWNEPSPSASP